MYKCLGLIWFVSIATCLTGCMVGPDFHKPPNPPVSNYTPTPLPKKTVHSPLAGLGGRTQYYAKDMDVPLEWWQLFHSPELDLLIRAGLKHSPTLAAAEAALTQAEENLNAQIGASLFPTVTAQFGASRQRISAASFSSSAFTDITTGTTLGSPSTVFNTFNTTVNVTYTLDVFGGARRQIEAFAAQVNYQEYTLIGAYLTLTTNIVTTAITIASLEDQIETTQSLIHLLAEQLNVLEKQYQTGGISEANVLTQKTLLSQTSATLPLLEKNLAEAQHALAVLVGEFPSKLAPHFQLKHLTLPKYIPISLPSNLIKQRPDVEAQEALLHAASAQIGVAMANLLPQFTINGDYGWSGFVLSSLFSSTNKMWLMAGQVSQTLFQGGALLAQRRAAIAAYKQALELYRQTVLTAFQNVADSLRAIETDARALRFEMEAETAAEKNLKIAKQQYVLGGSSYLDLVIVQQQYDQAKIARIQAEALRYNDTAALFKALGGGWWHSGICITNTC